MPEPLAWKCAGCGKTKVSGWGDLCYFCRRRLLWGFRKERMLAVVGWVILGIFAGVGLREALGADDSTGIVFGAIGVLCSIAFAGIAWRDHGK